MLYWKYLRWDQTSSQEMTHNDRKKDDILVLKGGGGGGGTERESGRKMGQNK